jgi:hypothetical protein
MNLMGGRIFRINNLSICEEVHWKGKERTLFMCPSQGFFSQNLGEETKSANKVKNECKQGENVGAFSTHIR